MVIDLTLTISQKLPSFPGSPQTQIIPWSSIKNDGYNLELLFLSSHTGTHLDAPNHFVDSGLTIDEIPIKRLVCETLLIDIKKGANQEITKQDIVNYEEKKYPIQKGVSVIFKTNWVKNIKKKIYFLNNPGLSISAANYLASKHVNLIGIDSPSIDSGKTKKFSVHKFLAKNKILILENLCNLEKIPNPFFLLVVLPLKINKASGSFARVIVL